MKFSVPGCKTHTFFILRFLFFFVPLISFSAVLMVPSLERTASIRITTEDLWGLRIQANGWAHLSAPTFVGGNVYCPVGTFDFPEIYDLIVPELTRNNDDEYIGASVQPRGDRAAVEYRINRKIAKPLFARAIKYGISDADTKTLKFLDELAKELTAWTSSKGSTSSEDNQIAAAIFRMKTEAPASFDLTATPRVIWLNPEQAAASIPVAQIDKKASGPVAAPPTFADFPEELPSTPPPPPKPASNRVEALARLQAKRPSLSMQVAYESPDAFYFTDFWNDFTEGSRVDKKTGIIHEWDFNRDGSGSFVPHVKNKPLGSYALDDSDDERRLAPARELANDMHWLKEEEMKKNRPDDIRATLANLIRPPARQRKVQSREAAVIILWENRSLLRFPTHAFEDDDFFYFSTSLLNDFSHGFAVDKMTSEILKWETDKNRD